MTLSILFDVVAYSVGAIGLATVAVLVYRDLRRGGRGDAGGPR